MRVSGIVLALSGLSLLSSAVPVPAQTLPAGFQRQQVIGARSNPTAIRFARDGRVYVAQKSGEIFEYDNLLDTSGTRIADLRTRVHNFWDRGLLGLALDPDFPDEPYLYVLYTHDAGIGGNAPRWGAVDQSGDGCGGALSNGGPTASNGGCVVSGRLSRLTLSNGTTTEQVLVEDWFQQYPSHSIGTVLVGADGFLYAGAGDGASFNFTDWGQSQNANFPDTDSPTDEGGALRAQDIRSSGDALGLSGTLIRVDRRTGVAAPGNPRFGAAGVSANERRVLAHGFRNPFRFTQRSPTNEVWIGDVGWNSWEEIDVVPDPTTTSTTTPTNHGWPCYEGVDRQGGYDAENKPLCETLYTAGASAVKAPFYAYAHAINTGASCTGSGSAVSGLAFYRGGAYPASYLNALFFADYNRDQIFALRDVNLDGVPDAPTQSGCGSTPEPTPYLFVNGGDINVVDLTRGPGGDLFYVSLDQGTISRVTFGANRAPSAAVRLAAGNTVRGGARTVALDASNTVDPDAGDTLTYAWDLDGDGQFDDASGVNLTTANVVLPATAVWRVGVRVSDQTGANDSAQLRVISGNTPPVATISAPTSPGALFRVGDVLFGAGSGSDAEDGNLPAANLEWTLIVQHCSDETFLDCHSHQVTSGTGPFVNFDAPDHEYPSFLRLRLTATDSNGDAAQSQVDILPAVANVTMATVPAGLQLAVGSAGATTTPFVHKNIANGEFSVNAITPQVQGATEYAFTQWSDGGTASHLARIAQPGNATLTATYAAHANPAVAISGRTSRVIAGDPFTYTITVSNLTTVLVNGITYAHTPPAAVVGAAWTCTATGGATCPAASGTGAISNSVNMPGNATLVYVFQGTLAAAPPATFTITATTAPPSGLFDSNVANNTANDLVDTLRMFANGFE